jgi:hypothetical protein
MNAQGIYDRQGNVGMKSYAKRLEKKNRHWRKYKSAKTSSLLRRKLISADDKGFGVLLFGKVRNNTSIPRKSPLDLTSSERIARKRP